MVVLLVAGFVVFKWLLPEYYLPVYWVAALFFYVFTFVVHAWQLNAVKKNLAKFANSNMIATFVKLLVYLLFTIGYISVKPKNAVAFVVVVMALYIVFTAAEVTSLSRFARSQNKKG